MRTMNTMSMIAMAATLAATPALAQEAKPATNHDMMAMMGGGMMGGNMMGMDAGPAMILKMRESLELTVDQVQKITAIEKTAQSGMQQEMMKGMQAMKAAEKQLDVTSPDLKKYEASLQDAANHMVQAHTGMARADTDAWQVLTAQQRDHLTFARKMMKEMKDGAEKEKMMMNKMKKDESKKDSSR